MISKSANIHRYHDFKTQLDRVEFVDDAHRIGIKDVVAEASGSKVL